MKRPTCLPMRLLFQSIVCISLLGAPCSLCAQSIRLVDASTREFRDPTYGVSFRLPASWTDGPPPASFDPLTITGPPDYSSDTIPLRASVFTTKLSEVPSWPVTSFAGVQFAYAVREQTTPDDCRYLSLSASQPGAVVQDVTRNGQSFHHGSGAGVGGGRGAEEEIFTASQGTSCLLFDLSEHFVSAGPDGRMLRALTRQESARMHEALMQIFASVRINHPAASTELPLDVAAKEFADPRFHIRFRYPASWSFSTLQQFYGPEAVLTTEAEKSTAGLTARAIVVAKSVTGTSLSGEDFVFNVVPGESLEACRDFLQQSRNLDHTDTRPVDGVPFFYATTAAAGLCHRVSETIYAHQAGGECYFFDLAIHTICTPEGGRDASPAEMREARYQLQSILHTVALK